MRLAILALTWPQKIAERLERLCRMEACIAGEKVLLLPGAVIGNNARNREAVQIGSHTISRGELNIFPPGGRIKIGSWCYIGDHTRIWSATGITIGDRVLISHGVNIHDHNAHPVSAAKRHSQTIKIFTGQFDDMDEVKMDTIIIEDDVWIGFNATIMKGVRIGRGAIIGAGTMIAQDVQPYAIMVGNPARQIGSSLP
jgi:acetyltransferase-like isoleucine patch superfamily enzyme